MTPPLLDVQRLAVDAPVTAGLVRDRVVGHRAIVDGVSLQIAAGESYGLVGESDSGASLVGRAVVQLVRADGGRILFDGVDIASVQGEALRTLRRRFQMVFPRPGAGLDPRLPVESLLVEALRGHGVTSGAADERIHTRELADAVGLPLSVLSCHAHELTGLQRRQVEIAVALSVGPELLVVDEPVAGLDVSGQAHVLNRLVRLRAERRLSYLVISRDLAVVRYLSDRIGVLYRGGLVEEAPAGELRRPLHPYARALLAAVPVADPDRADQRERIVLRAEADGSGNSSGGCPFHQACPWRQPRRCADERPQLRGVVLGGGPDHRVACHFAESIRRGWIQAQHPSSHVAR